MVQTKEIPSVKFRFTGKEPKHFGAHGLLNPGDYILVNPTDALGLADHPELKEVTKEQTVPDTKAKAAKTEASAKAAVVETK